MKNKICIIIVLLNLLFFAVLSPVFGETGPGVSIFPKSFSDTLNIVASFEAPDVITVGLVHDGTYMWSVGSGTNKIYQSDTSGNVISSFDTPGAFPFGLTYDGTCLWLSEFGNGRVYQLDTSGNILTSFGFSGKLLSGLAYQASGQGDDEPYLWASDFETRKIYKLDTSGNVITSFDSPGSDPISLEYDGTHLWHTDSKSRRIYKLDTSGNLIASYDSPVEKPYGLAYDGTHLWLSDDKEDKIHQVETEQTVTAIGSSVSRTFTITNSGDEPLIMGKLSITGRDTSDFRIENDNCSGQTMAPSEAGTYDIVFSPFSAGGRNAILEIPSNDPDIPTLDMPLSGTGEGVGYLVTSDDLWIRAVINTQEKGRIEAVWQKGGEDETEAGDRVIWGYFHASPDDVNWGSRQNPDVFVKIWFDRSGRVDVNYFHVSVPDIDVYSDYPYDGVPDTHGVTTLDTRYIRQYYQDGESEMDEKEEDGNPPPGYSPVNDPPGYYPNAELRIGAVISTREKGDIEMIWSKGGQDATAGGHQVIWGHFYASPLDVNWGSADNPDLFVKIWFDASGRTDVNFFHVSVPDIEVFSDFPADKSYDEKGTTILDNRYIRNTFQSSSPLEPGTITLTWDPVDATDFENYVLGDSFEALSF